MIALCLAILTIGQVSCFQGKARDYHGTNENEEKWLKQSNDQYDYTVSEKYRSVLDDRGIEPFGEIRHIKYSDHFFDDGVTRTKTTTTRTERGFIVDRVEKWITKNPEKSSLGAIVYGVCSYIAR